MLAFSRQARTFPSLCAAKWLSVLKSQIFKEMESNQNKMVYSIPQVSKDEKMLYTALGQQSDNCPFMTEPQKASILSSEENSI